MKKCICVTSGGGDSVANGLMMLKDGYDVIFLHINHGQKCAIGEKAACEFIVNELINRGESCRLEYVEFRWLGRLGGCGLTDELIDVPDGIEGIYGSTIGTIFTPGRNSLFLGIAASLAESERAEYITMGCNQSEVGYKDNTKEFLDKYTEVLEYSTYHIHPKIISPEWNMDKVGIYKWIIDNNYGWVLESTWSCDSHPKRLGDDDRRNILPCGVCGCCRNKQLTHYILEKTYGSRYGDKMIYDDMLWFYGTCLPTLKKNGVPNNKWFKKYEEVIIK